MTASPRQDPARTLRRWLGWAAASGGLALGVATLYLGLYRWKGSGLPVGFDAPWYVWRAGYVAAHGLGALGTAARPGHEILAAVVGSLTGRSQVELGVLLGPVLAAGFALALGALAWFALGPDARRWTVVVVVGGGILGATRLVDENVATLLFLAVLVAALVPLVAAAAGSETRFGWRPFAGAVALFVAAGLAHWLFLGVFALVLAGTVVLLLPASLRRRSDGVPPLRTEAGVVAAALATAGAAMTLVIGAILRAPVDTIEVAEDPSRFLPKLANDARRLALPVLAPLAALGAVGLARTRTSQVAAGSSDARRRDLLLRVLVAWAAVALVGVAYGAGTKDLPPHRFLELLVVGPGVLALAEAVGVASRWSSRRVGATAGWAVVAVAAAGLALPGVVGWYGSGAPAVWIDAAGLQQARIASSYVDRLPEGRPFVVLVSPFGPAGTLSVPLKERTIRMGIDPARQAELHLFVGTPSDLLAGRRSLAPGAATNVATLAYWLDVRPVLAERPPVLILKAFAPKEFGAATAAGTGDARAVGPGVALLQGPPARPVAAQPVPSAFPGIRAAAGWALVVLALLGVAGLGWTATILGPGTPPPVIVGLAPAVGTGAVILAGTLVSRAGAALGGGAGAAVYAAIALAGSLAGVRAWRSPEIRVSPAR